MELLLLSLFPLPLRNVANKRDKICQVGSCQKMAAITRLESSVPPLNRTRGIAKDHVFPFLPRDSIFTGSNSLEALCKSEWTVRDLVNPLPISDTGTVTSISRGWMGGWFFKVKAEAVPWVWAPRPIWPYSWIGEAGLNPADYTIRHKGQKKKKKEKLLREKLHRTCNYVLEVFVSGNLCHCSY